LRVLLDTIPNPVFYKDRAGRYLGCNRAFEEAIGAGSAELLGKTVHDVAPPELALHYAQKDAELMSRGGRQEYEGMVRVADGSLREVLFCKGTFESADGAVGGLIGTFVDITDRKRAEAELQEQRTLAESLVRNAAIPVFVIRSDRRVIFWNSACEKLTGIPAAEMVGTTGAWRAFYDQEEPVLAELVLSPGSPPGGYDIFGKSALLEEGLRAEGWYPCVGGERRYLTFEAAPIRNASGEVVAAIETLQDMTWRKLAEEALAESERRFRLAVDNFPQTFMIYDADRRFTFINRIGIESVGLEEGRILGRRDEEVLPPEVTTGYLAHLQRAFREKRRVTVKCPVLLQGVERHVHASYVPVLDEEGNILQVLGVVTDVTKRREALEQVRKLSSAVEQSPDSIIITDRNGVIEYVNPQFTAATGYHREEVLGKTPALLKSDRHPREFFLELWQTVMSGSVWHGEFCNRHKSGDLYWESASVAPIRDADGTISHFVAVMQDITDRRRKEDEVRRSASLLQATLQATGDAILVLDQDSRIVSHNDRFAQMWGFDGKLLSSGDGVAAVARMVRQLKDPTTFASRMRESRTFEGETRDLLELLDGRAFEAFSAPQRLGDRVVGRVWSFHDVTEGRRLETQLRHAQKMEALGTLAGGVAHDFNNLLTTIMGYAALVRMKMKPEDPNAVRVNHIVAAAERGAGLTQSLLAYSRRRPTDFKPVDVNAVLRDVEKLLYRLIGEDVALETEAAEGPLTVLADSGQLEQVLMNLATNAR
ncbi:MAG TPA: PAS domain S-box protein, partial [Verrucomicrobiae bacterium]|nr:PAS domain S-box protein [Verrucomicrobiae bacterium]